MNRLVILASNWLGDAVMALPAVVAIRRALPDATITVAARPPIRSLFAIVPEITETIAIEELGRGAADVAILFPNSFRSALLAFRARIPERWGYRTDWRGALLSRGVEPPRGLHQVEAYRRLAQELGFPNPPLEPRLALPETICRQGVDELRSAGWDGKAPLLALAPGAAFGGAKRWPPEFFAGLVGACSAEGIRSVLVGSASDRPVGREITRLVGQSGRAFDLIGQNDVAGMAGILAVCRALVSNDSGAMHLGAAVGLPVIAIFGPTDERLTRPVGGRHRVIAHPVWCRPCMLRECPLDHRCMRGIRVEAVADAVRDML